MSKRNDRDAGRKAAREEARALARMRSKTERMLDAVEEANRQLARYHLDRHLGIVYQNGSAKLLGVPGMSVFRGNDVVIREVRGRPERACGFLSWWVQATLVHCVATLSDLTPSEAQAQLQESGVPRGLWKAFRILEDELGGGPGPGC